MPYSIVTLRKQHPEVDESTVRFLNPYKLEHYHSLAKRRGYEVFASVGKNDEVLELTAAPRLASEKVAWRCINCHKVFRCSYDSFMQRHQGSCTCLTGLRRKKREDYEELARLRRIEYLGNKNGTHPIRTTAKTWWRSEYGEFEVSYSDLSRVNPPGYVKQYLPDYREVIEETDEE